VTSPRESIAELVHRYCDAVVRQDREQWGNTWSEDSVWELGPNRVLEGRGPIIAHWQESIARNEVVVHQAANGHVGSTSETTAEGRWYITEHLKRRTGELGMLLAWYDDTYVCEDGSWLFASRRLTPIYRGPPDLSGTWSCPS
jgi:ketosteroid isomerase-like protein